MSPLRPALLAFALMTLGSRAVLGQGAATSEPVVLEYADSLKSETRDSGVVRHFLGHVKVHQGNVLISCDQATHYLSTNVVSMLGNVKIVQDTLTITAPQAVYEAKTKVARAEGSVRLSDRVAVLTASRGTYNTETRIAVFKDKVKIVNDTATITADEITYDRNTEGSVARGHVTIIDSTSIISCATLRNDRVKQLSWCSGNVHAIGRADRSQLFGDSLFHNAKDGYTHIPKHPFLEHVDSVKNDSLGGWKYDTMYLTSITMESFRTTHETYHAHDSVRMFRGAMQARCGEAVFQRSEDRITLSRSPVLWYHDTQLTGDSITVDLFRNKLQRVACEGSAFAVVTKDSLHPMRFDQLSGSRLMMFFRDDSLRRIRVEKNAQSVYFGSEEGKSKGANRATGDTIEITMAHGKPEFVYTLGGGEGQYWPEKLVRKNELDFRLSGFESHEADRPRRAEFLRR